MVSFRPYAIPTYSEYQVTVIDGIKDRYTEFNMYSQADKLVQATVRWTNLKNKTKLDKYYFL